jgi:hypothetical protein
MKAHAAEAALDAGGFLLLNLALAFYNVGTIWAHEVDIFRTWTLVSPGDFHRIQQAHWRKLPYWIFVPVGLSFAGSVGLLWFHPASVSVAMLRAAFATQLASHILTAVLWGPWQAKLSRDERASRSPYLGRILATHWIRTALISAYGIILLIAAMRD